MQIDFNTVLKNVDGDIIKINDEGKNKGKDLTLGHISRIVLDIPFSFENKIDKDGKSNLTKKPLTNEEKYHRYDMFMQTMKGKVDITVEEVSLLKELISKQGYNNLLTGRCFDILEGKNKKQEK